MESSTDAAGTPHAHMGTWVKKKGAPPPTKGEGGIGRQRTRQHLGRRNWPVTGLVRCAGVAGVLRRAGVARVTRVRGRARVARIAEQQYGRARIAGIARARRRARVTGVAAGRNLNRRLRSLGHGGRQGDRGGRQGRDTQCNKGFLDHQSLQINYLPRVRRFWPRRPIRPDWPESETAGTA